MSPRRRSYVSPSPARCCSEPTTSSNDRHGARGTVEPARQLAPRALIRSNRPMSSSPTSPSDGRQDLPAITGDPAALLRVPRATYRLQLGPDLTFDDAAALVPYLEALGISDCYISPFFETSST